MYFGSGSGGPLPRPVAFGIYGDNKLAEICLKAFDEDNWSWDLRAFEV